MSKRLKPPSYRLHPHSGQARVTLPNGPMGPRKDFLLGKFNSPESITEYNRITGEWMSNGRYWPGSSPVAPAPVGLSINELILRFMEHAEKHYQRDGKPSREFVDYCYSLKPLKDVYGLTPALEFGPLKLDALRNKMIEADWSRGLINQRIGRIKRVFKWAVSRELLAESIYSTLLTVEGLQRGRSDARETQPVKPIHPQFVEATIPHVLPPVAAMIRLQMLTGMRPGEVVQMRGVDLDMSGPTWLFTPARHKTDYKGHTRVIPLGPKAQAIVREFLTPNVEAHLFSPARGMEHRAHVLRINRKSKVQPSQQNRRKAKKAKQPGDRYQRESYSRAIATGAAKADYFARLEAEKQSAINECRMPKPVPRKVLAEFRLIPHWHPHQLRHSHATMVRKQYGIEAAGAALGHSRMSATEVYAERNLSLAERVALEVG